MVSRRDFNRLRLYAAGVTGVLAAILAVVVYGSLFVSLVCAAAAVMGTLALTIPTTVKEKKATITYEIIDEVEAKYGYGG